MQHDQPIQRIVDLTDPSSNVIFNMTIDQARAHVAAGDVGAVRKIQGHFALLSTNGQNVLMARSIARPLRYFIAKRAEGPALIASDRIDAIHQHLRKHNLADQFHPSYTRMVPAHYITEVALIGCPDPNPIYRRFFTPQRNALPPDLQVIGERYIGALYNAILQWLQHRAVDGPIGVCFSGGIDSGSVFFLTYHAMLELGMSPSRLKAFTLAVDGRGEDLRQARAFLDTLGLGLFLEPVEVPTSAIAWRETIGVMEDYKPLDVQSGAMALALCRGIRKRYPDWRFLLDGDGGDENLKDYPIEENPELTIRSVLNNLMLYHEGWGVEAIKHSLTYTGGLSRGYVRSYAPAATLGFDAFSPYTLPDIIEVAEGIPFIELTNWSHDKLYDLKGAIVAAGVKSVTGRDMPIFPKRRFQHGAAERGTSTGLFPANEPAYRRAFHEHFERAATAASGS